MSGQGDVEVETRVPWAWLRGFAWFLVAWPVLGLLAADQFADEPWSLILGVYLVPAAIGLALLGVDRLATRWLGDVAALRGAPAPASIRDLSNLGLCLAGLLAVDLVLVTSFEETPFDHAPNAPRQAALLLAWFLGPSLVLRVVHRLLYGGARHVDLGPEWEYDHDALHVLGYLTLIPTLLVATVMIDHALNEASEFGLRAWVAIPALLLLGLRSAMASAPRHWARNPWEAVLRRLSLYVAWWTAAWLLGVGVSVVLLLTPFGLGDDAPSAGERIFGAVFLAPLGLLCLAGAAVAAWHALPNLVRQTRAYAALIRAPNALVRWHAWGDDPTWVRLELQDGRAFVVALPGDAAGEALVAWLTRHMGTGPTGAPPERTAR